MFLKPGEEPWIDADGASLEAIIDVICSCPSGALSYSIDNREHQDQQQNPVITVIKNGPYSVSGDIAVVDQAVGDGASAGRYTLCRCGASRNKPYCDGSHWDIGFKDEEQ